MNSPRARPARSPGKPGPRARSRPHEEMSAFSAESNPSRVNFKPRTGRGLIKGRGRERPNAEARTSGGSHERSGRDRPQAVRLPARLPFGLRARRRGRRRVADRTRPRRAGPDLHRGGRVRESRPLQRADPPPRPVDGTARAGRARRARDSSPRSDGTKRSTASRRPFSRPSGGSGRKASGPISTPARWAS